MQQLDSVAIPGRRDGNAAISAVTAATDGSSNQLPASVPRAIPVGRSLAAGAVAAIWSVSNTVAYAGLIFAGGAAAGLPLGVSTLLLGFALLTAIIALASRTPGIAAVGFGGTALVYVAAVQLVDAQLALQGLPEGNVRGGAAVIACGFITLAAGAVLGICGLLRIGSLVRLLPHPVSAGFFCGLGAGFTVAAFGMALGVAPRAELLGDVGAVVRVSMCLTLGVLLVVLPRWTRHWAVMPAVLLAATLAYHAARLALGQSVGAAQATGWLLGPFPEAGVVLLPPLASFGVFDAGLFLSLLPFVASAALLSAVTLAVLVTGLESIIKKSMDVDREMAVAGMANLASGAAGGMLGGHGLVGTSVFVAFGARNRLAATVAAAAALGVLALGPAVLGLVPRPVLAALLLSFGIEQMVLRTWRESRRLPWHETAILLMVAVTMATVGIVEGLALGLGLALLIFVWTYRKVPVIRSILRGDEMRSSVARTGAALRMLEREGHRILLFRLQGYMFFLNAQSVHLAFAQSAAGVRFVILDFHHVLGLDSSAADVFRRLEQDAGARGVTLVLSGVRPTLAERFAWQGVFRDALRSAVPNADRGLEHAEERLLAELDAGTDERPVRIADFLLSIEAVPELVDRLEPFIERVAFAPGEALMRQGGAADDMIFLEQGRVVATLQEQGQEMVHLRTLTAGTVVGEIALVRGGCRTASVTAETPCEGIRLTRDALKRMEAADPILALIMHRTIMLQLADKLADNTRAVDLALR